MNIPVSYNEHTGILRQDNMVNDFSDWDEAQVSTDSVLYVEDNVANLRLMEEIVDRVEGL